MDYSSIYNCLMDRAKNREIGGYIEKHHITPRCLGGNDSKNNLVGLTAREHFISHLLLVKIYPDNHKLVYAANMMTVGNCRNNKEYEWLKKRRSSVVSNQMKNRIRRKKKWITDGKDNKLIDYYSPILNNWYEGRTLSESNKSALKNALSKPCNEETKIKISKSKTGYKHSEETKSKISQSMTRNHN